MQYSDIASVFHGRTLPERGRIAGYAAIINALNLPVPMPGTLSVISLKRRRYEVEGWRVFTPRYDPGDDLYPQLVFALKYEGVNLLVLKKLFARIPAGDVAFMISQEPTGKYARLIWFLCEWLTGQTLPLPDASTKIRYIRVVDPELQFCIEGEKSSRHRVINNLPGTPEFCPLISRTEKLVKYIERDLGSQTAVELSGMRKDIMLRAAAFLMLKDSKASFAIEGESPKSKRMAKWGEAIGQAGSRPLSKEELVRLQQIVIESDRFINLGFRKEGGFVGEYDRDTLEPIPEHISARWQDLDSLIQGLIETHELLQNHPFDAVLAATMISFGFVFIHPFSDGNGRLHRYLIHHVLTRKGFSPEGTVFPVSAAILDKIGTYRRVLQSYSHPVLDFIEWKSTPDHNVEVLNDTVDYYRYFDATKYAEFLYDCVHDTITRIIPEEVRYLYNYDAFKRYLDDTFEMPDKMVAMLVRFLEQGDGKLSKRARKKEFLALSDDEVVEIELRFGEIFGKK